MKTIFAYEGNRLFAQENVQIEPLILHPVHMREYRLVFYQKQV